jgi:hypothetical protein
MTERSRSKEMTERSRRNGMTERSETIDEYGKEIISQGNRIVQRRK